MTDLLEGKGGGDEDLPRRRDLIVVLSGKAGVKESLRRLSTLPRATSDSDNDNDD